MKSLENERTRKKNQSDLYSTSKWKHENIFFMLVVIVSSVSIDTTFRRSKTWSRCHNEATTFSRTHTYTRTPRSHDRAKQTLNARRIEYYGKKWAAVSISKRIVVACRLRKLKYCVFFLFSTLSVVDVLTFRCGAAWARDLSLFRRMRCNHQP